MSLQFIESCFKSFMKRALTTTNMQAKLRCKRKSKSPDSLDEDLTVDANLTLKSSHHLANFFNHPLVLAPICIYAWIPI
jgi:hypothetical protein